MGPPPPAAVPQLPVALQAPQAQQLPATLPAPATPPAHVGGLARQGATLAQTTLTQHDHGYIIYNTGRFTLAGCSTHTQKRCGQCWLRWGRLGLRLDLGLGLQLERLLRGLHQRLRPLVMRGRVVLRQKGVVALRLVAHVEVLLVLQEGRLLVGLVRGGRVGQAGPVALAPLTAVVRPAGAVRPRAAPIHLMPVVCGKMAHNFV